MPKTRKYPPDLLQSIHIKRGSRAEDFQLSADGTKAKVWVIELIRDQIINKRSSAWLDIRDGKILPNTDQDVLKLAVVERYGKNGNLGTTFVHGFGLKKGAIASSVAHDHHNIVIAGTNDEDMAACVRAVDEMQGGLAMAVDGKVIGTLPLPIAGLMSDKSAEGVIRELKDLNMAYAQNGGVLAAPFMALSFISLPTVPELGITDLGLVEVENRKIITSVIETSH